MQHIFYVHLSTALLIHVRANQLVMSKLPSFEGSETISSTHILLVMSPIAGTFLEFLQNRIEHFCQMCSGEIRKAKSHLKIIFEMSIQSTLKHS